MKKLLRTILVYVSSANRVPHREGGYHTTGVFLGELIEPLEPLLKAGYEIVFVSPDGRPCTIDPKSLKLLYWSFSRKKRDHALGVLEKLKKRTNYNNPYAIEGLLEDLKRLYMCDALFIPGGHAPMTDIVFKNWFESDEYNRNTGKLLQHFHEKQKPTVAICHGVAALAAAPKFDGTWIYDGYRMTCVSMMAEHLSEDIPFWNDGGHMKAYPVRLLKSCGAHVKNALLGRSLVVRDKELLTGQDPLSADALGNAFLEMMKEHYGQHQ